MPTTPTSDGRPLSWYGPVRAALPLLAVILLILGSVLDVTAVALLAPVALLVAGILDLGRRRSGGRVPGAAPVVLLALVMGAAGFADWPPDTTAWTFIGLSALAIGLALFSSRPAHRRA